MTAGNETLAVFARAPELGRVKTRLCPPMTADEALRLHRALLEDTLEHLGKLQRPFLSRVLLLSRALQHASDLEIPRGWTVGIQSPGNLGEKLESFSHGSFRRGVERLLILGGDSPTLPLDVVHDAFEALSRSDVVLGPAADGGYYLIGARIFLPDVFREISWGTAEVLRQTRSILETLGNSYELLVPWYDIDRPGDLARLREEIGYLRRSRPELVPHRTARALPDIAEPEYSPGPDFE
ncbi:MAG: TIGR04282 family arsenosugar biosynthesis glycosyltransferase [Vicinamibacteria bacterium]